MIEPATDRTDRALSELIGYIVIFSLVTLAATSVFVVGSGHLEATRDAEQLANAEKAFEVLAGNIDDHIDQATTGRSTEVRIADADLYVEEGDAFEVNITHSNPDLIRGEPDNSDNYSRTAGIAPITYESASGSKVVYSNGAVFRERSESSYMIYEPKMLIDEDRAVVPIVRTRVDGLVTDPGSSVVQVRTERGEMIYLSQTAADEAAGDDPYTVEIRFETTEQRAEMWERDYFGSMDALQDCTFDASSDELSCTFETYEVYVPIAIVDVEIN